MAVFCDRRVRRRWPLASSRTRTRKLLQMIPWYPPNGSPLYGKYLSSPFCIGWDIQTFAQVVCHWAWFFCWWVSLTINHRSWTTEDTIQLCGLICRLLWPDLYLDRKYIFHPYRLRLTSKRDRMHHADVREAKFHPIFFIQLLTNTFLKLTNLRIINK